MSDASEVKRWETIAIDSKIPGVKLDVDSVPRVVVVSAEDHDRIMAERDELWKRATKFVMPGEMDTGESIEHYIKTLEQTIARQARVIEKLKRYTQHRVDCICRAGVLEYSEDCDCGLDAIEQQGEGT